MYIRNVAVLLIIVLIVEFLELVYCHTIDVSTYSISSLAIAISSLISALYCTSRSDSYRA